MKTLVLFLTMLMIQNTEASLLQTKAGANNIQGVTIAESAVMKVGEESVNMKMVGAGLRRKKVAIAKVKVYVAQIFLDSPEKFIATDESAIKSAASSRVSAVQLTFLRDVDTGKITQSFTEAFQLNQVDTNTPEIKELLAAVVKGGEAKDKSVVTITNVKEADGSETVQYEGPDGLVTQIKGTAGFSERILVILFGKTNEKEVAELRKQILTYK